MNRIYQSLRLFTNFFLPVMQLTRKTRQGAKVTRSYDVSCTPYERVLASHCIADKAKQVLRAQYQRLDPVALHDTILEDERHLRGPCPRQETRPAPHHSEESRGLATLSGFEEILM